MKKVEKLIVQQMAAVQSPGFALTYVKDGKIVYQRCFGTKNRERDSQHMEPVTGDTCFELGSCTKIFTGTAILHLQDQGKLSIKDPVKKYLKWFDLGSDEDPIRIQHLLSHTSGIPDLNIGGFTSGRALGEDEGSPLIPISTEEDYHFWINNATSFIKFKPGKKHLYCNDGYILLGKIIAKTSGETYENYVRNHIMKPIGMTRSFFMTEKPPEDGDVAVHYKHLEGKLVPAPRSYNELNNSAGGLVCSSNEIVQYMNLVINRGSLDGTTILSPDSFKSQTRIQAVNDSKIGHELPITGKYGYGYGWSVVEGLFNHKLIHHGGDTGVCLSEIMVIPDLKIGCFSTTNARDDFSTFYYAGLLALMGKNPEEVLPGMQVNEIDALLAGEYESYQGLSKATLIPMGSGLMMINVEGMPMPMPIIPDEKDPTHMRYFLYAGGIKFIVQFYKEDDGNVFVTLEAKLFQKV